MANGIPRQYCHYIEKQCTAIEPLDIQQGLFFAYPSEPETSADAIRAAIARINESRTPRIPALDWRDLPIEGNIILCEICKAIRTHSCTVVNTTYVNFNVLFEYGFAVGSGRAIWPLVEEGVSKDELVSTNIKSITTIGYSQFSNGTSIFKKITKKRPWDRASQFDLPVPLKDGPTREASGLLYIKSAQNNEPSLRISEALSTVRLELIIDDPNEVPFRHLAWYLSQIGKSYAVIIHLGNERMLGAQLHWAKCALVAGMALALGRRLLLLGESISLEPIDYRDLLRSYKNAHEAETVTKAFISKVEPELARYGQYVGQDIRSPGAPTGTVLSYADLGDYVAENEQVSLQNYFIETTEFSNALKPKCTVFVGRKGIGKTAHFYMIGNRFMENQLNLVCMIKPREYELNELLAFVKEELDAAKKGYLLESMWKFMLYSEALSSAKTRILKKHGGIALFELSEKRVLDYLQQSAIVADESFTSRLVQTVRKLCQIPSQGVETQVAVSEILHVKEISQMRDIICDYMKNERLERFAMLVDGLDANWRMGEEHETMADILLALIGAARDVWRECTNSFGTNEHWKGASISIFVRSDVFTVSLERARDPDKLQFESLSWPNADALVGIVVRRILANSGGARDNLNWRELLEPGFEYEDMKAFLSNNVLARPRDYIYYFQRVIYFARSRGTKYITKRDFQSALSEYSQWVILSLSAEAQPYIPNMLDLLLGFDQQRAVLTVNEIDQILNDAGVQEKDCRKALNFLVDVNFLGYGIDANNYRFPSSPAEETIMKRRFLRHVKGDYSIGRFKIHNAFHPVLSIQT